MSGCSSRQRKTAKSSRIPPQAREYITEMAEDRELERFMALSSTASSGASGSLHTCAVRVSVTTEPAGSHGSRPGTGRRARHSRSKECQPASTEEALLQLPPSPPVQQEKSPADSYRIIPIVLVEDQAKPRPAAATQTLSLSVEDLRTPTKPATEMHTKKTQTPESALKSHKRLEWDPAADVGYYKRALSTSNISTLERSVLEECGWRQPMQQQSSETDLDRLLQRQESEHKADTPMQEKTTVPLASSTMVSRQVASAGASRKVDSHGSSRGEVSNSSSTGEGTERSSKGEVSKSRSQRETSQSSSKGEAPSRSSKGEVSKSRSKGEAFQSSSKGEATESSSKGEAPNRSSKREDSYSSSRKATTSQSSSRKETTSLSSSKKETPSCSSSRKEDSSNVEALPAQVSSRRSSLISSRRESLSSYALAASRVSSQAENSHSSSRMGSEMSSRRESQATSLYGSSAASSFDYHINREEQAWLKSLQKPQQKGKRGEEHPDQVSHEQSEKEPSQADHCQEEDQRKTEHRDRDQKKVELREKDLRKAEREKELQKAEQREKDLRRAEQREKEREQERQFTAAQFERVLGSRRRENKENQLPPAAPAAQSHMSAAGTAAKGDLDLGIDLLCSLVEARSLSQSQKKKLVRDIARRIACLDLTESSSTATSSSRRERARGVPVPLQRQDVATNTSAPGSRSSSLKGQTLPVPAPRKRNADGTPSPLPSTSSYSAISSNTSASNEVITQKTNIPAQEAEAEAASADATDVDAEPMSAIREALNPMTQSEIEYEERMKAGMDPERRSQLNWIEAEIERLQSLKVFLAEIEAQLPSRSEIEKELIVAGPEEEQEQESSSAEGRRRRKAAKRLAKAVQTEDLDENPTPKPPVRVESVRVPPRTARPASDLQAPPPLPRTRMATPVLASHSSSSGRSESVSSFVQQRHRRFREHYQNQQQQQLLLVKQQQLRSLQQQNKQQQHKQQQQLYQHKLVQGEQHIVHEPHCPTHGKLRGQQEQPYMQMMQYDQTTAATASGSAYATPHSSASASASASGCYSCADNERAIYCQVVNSPGASASYVQAEPAAAAAERSTTTTSSSLMCLSSEMSIPMGRVNTCETTTTTTTTTTHQYDEVACQRRKERMQRQTLQVRPRGIAYMIQFTGGGGEVVPETQSLQDQLQLARPEFCAKSKQRKAILNQMQMMRNLRRREMEELVAQNNCSLETLDRRLRQLPPPATSRLRIFTTKEMKALTSKRCQSLPEVLDAVNRELETRRRRTNRLMRDIFNKRMKNRVSHGQISLNHSRTII